MLDSVTEMADPPVTAVSLGRFDINAVVGKKTSAPGAASLTHITDAERASHAQAITLIIENMFQRRIGSFQSADHGG